MWLAGSFCRSENEIFVSTRSVICDGNVRAQPAQSMIAAKNSGASLMYLVLIMSYHPCKLASVNLNLPSFTCRAMNLHAEKNKAVCREAARSAKRIRQLFFCRLFVLSRPLRLAVPRFYYQRNNRKSPRSLPPG